MKPASGRLENIYCSKGRHKATLTLSGYDDTAPRGGVRVAGTCAAGHEVALALVGRDTWAKAISSGKVTIGRGGGCPYATGAAESEHAIEESNAMPLFEGSRKSRKSSRSGSRKSRKSRSGSRKSRKSRSGSRKSRKASHSGSRKSRKSSR